jgi:hypothetical protein
VYNNIIKLTEGKVANKMRKFEIGKIYKDSGMAFRITARTEKTVRFVEIQHLGRFNEREGEEKRARIKNWETREVFFVGSRLIEA